MHGKGFRHVLDEFGFVEVPETVFRAEDIAAFHQRLPTLPASPAMTARLLTKALHKGIVEKIETLADGRTVWTVTFRCMGCQCTYQFMHRHDTWRTCGTLEVAELKGPLKRYPLAWKLSVGQASAVDAAAIALLVAASFAFGKTMAEEAGKNTVTASEAVEMAKEDGHIVLTPEEKRRLEAQVRSEAYRQMTTVAQREPANAASGDEQRADAKAEGAQTKAAKAKDDGEKGKKRTDNKKKNKQTDNKKKKSEGKEKKKKRATKKEEAPKETVLVFTMREGMAIDDLVSALHKYKFIKDKDSFISRMEKLDLITNVKPGDYEFKSGMSEDDVIAELQ